MASFTHIAVGLLTARVYAGIDTQATDWRTWKGPVVVFSAVSLLPDADILGVALGFPDTGFCGHRGASHALTTALLIGIAAGLLARRAGYAAVRTAVAVTVAMGSHGIIDCITESGRGIPLLWPFTDTRFQGPFAILPDAPRGLAFLSHRGLRGFAFEFVCFLPVTVFSLWPRRGRRASALARAANVGAPALPAMSGEAPALPHLGASGRPMLRLIAGEKRPSPPSATPEPARTAVRPLAAAALGAGASPDPVGPEELTAPDHDGRPRSSG